MGTDTRRAGLAARSMATALLVLLCGSAVVTSAHGAAGSACAGVRVLDGWKKIAAPLPVAAFTVHERAGLVVAGDDRIMSSRDGGCTWRTLFEVSSPLPVDERLVALVSSGGSLVAASTGPHVFVSRDGGTTWAAGDAGLDVPGQPVGLYPGPAGVVYMAVRQKVTDGALAGAGVPEQGTSVLATVLYRSPDGGTTWVRRGDPQAVYSGPYGTDVEGGGAPGALWDVAVDPLDADHLLAASKGGISRSTDGGGTWRVAVFSTTAEARTVSITHVTRSAPGAAAVDPRSGTLYRSSDVSTGAWTASVHPQLRTEQMAAYPDAAPWAWSAYGVDGALVVSGPKGVFRDQAGTLVDVTAAGVGSVAADLQVLGGAGGRALWARLLDGSALLTALPERRPDAIAPIAGSNGTGGGAALAGRPPGISVPDVDDGAIRLVPERRKVTLDPGESRTVTYEARIEPQPAPVDVYFLVDTTSSMTDTLRSLTLGMEEIVTRLAGAGIELRAGVGAFRTYPRESERQLQNYPYRRVRALGPVDGDLVRSLYDLEGAGSSGANLTALYQALTGEGQDVLPPGPSKGDVEPGLAAGFRETSTKVVVHFADTWFGTPDRGDPNGYYAPGTWPGPTFEQTSAAMRAASVKHLGVAIQPSGGGTLLAEADVRDDLRLLSRRTSSLAGERGADCDGDGTPDLRPDEPLVCPLEREADASGLAAVVAGLVEALEDRGPVAFVESGRSGMVSEIAPALYPAVDLRGSNDLSFEVTVGCGVADAGDTRPVHLSLRVRGGEVAASTLRVACTAPLASDPAPTSTSPEPRVPLVPPIPAPPPPPHSVPGLGPGSVTAPAPVQAPAPAQAPGGQPQGALVAQRQQQPQLAFVAATQQVRTQTQMQHAMVRTTARDPLGAAKAWTAVGALTILWGWGLASALASSVRPAPATRRHPRTF